MTWLVIHHVGEIHVVPRDDLRPHRLSSACLCHPSLDEIWIHHSFDKRELTERPFNEPN